jgi:uncharacterized protein YoxC
MTTEQLTEKVFAHEKSIGKLEEDVTNIYKRQAEIKDLAKSTQELALAVQQLATKVNDVDDRISMVEGTQRTKSAAIWQIVMSVIISGIGTYLISNLFR